MKVAERSVRKYHGILGVILSVFIIIQVGSGTLIVITTLIEQRPHTHGGDLETNVHVKKNNDEIQNPAEKVLEVIHHHGDAIYQIFRVFLGVGILAMAVSGSAIYLHTQKRKKRMSNQHGLETGDSP